MEKIPELNIAEQLKKDREELEKAGMVPKKDEEKYVEQGDLSQAELNQAITDFQAKQAQIAEMRAKKAGRWASLRKTLGLKEKNLDGDPEVMILEKESHDLYRSLMAKGINLYKGDKPQLEGFLGQFDEFEVFRNGQNQELDKKAEVAGFPENIIAGMKTLTKKWSELNWKQKLAISIGGGALIGAGAFALGAGTFGAAALSAGYKWGFRAFGAAAAGVGRNVMLDRQMMDEMRNEAEKWVQDRMEELEKYENNLDQGIEDMLGKTSVGDIKKNFEQRRTENELRAWKFARNTFVVSVVVGEALAASGISFGNVIRKLGEYTGLSGAGIKESAENFLSGQNVSAEEGSSLQNWAETTRAAGATEHNPVDSYPEGKYGPAGYGTETEDHGDVVKSTDERYGPGKYGPTGHGTETEDHINELDERYGPNKTGTEGEGHVPDTKPSFIEEAKTSPAAGALTPDDKYSPGKYGPGLYGTEGEGHIPEPEDMSGVRAPDAEAQVADLGNRELGYSKVYEGGGIEKSAQDIIRANPKAFGLNPNDPRFHGRVGDKAHELAEGMRKKFGLSHKVFDRIASHNIQPGDEIRVFQDSSTGKMNLTYNGAAFDRVLSPDNIHGAGAPAQEVAPSRAGVTVDDMKPKAASVAPDDATRPRAGATAEQQPTRVRGGGKTMQYETDTPDQKIAKDDFAKAEQYQKELRAFNSQESSRLEAVNEMANSRLYLSTRGALNQLVNGAGVSDRANFWGHSMDDWKDLLGSEKYLAQDIRLADGTRGASFDKLKGLYPILERFHRQGFETIGECLKQAVKDPKILEKINKSVL